MAPIDYTELNKNKVEQTMLKEVNAILIENPSDEKSHFVCNQIKLNKTSKTMKLNLVKATGLNEAVRLISTNPVDIIILDLSLTGSIELSGILEIKKHFGTKLPIIALTNDHNEMTALRALDFGAKDYLFKKEITPLNIARSIRYALEINNSINKLEDIRFNQTQSLKMATLGEMASGMAHEINNPLTVILAYADRIINVKNKEISKDEISRYGEKILSVTYNVAKIVKSLKAYSRNDENDLKEHVKLGHIIDNTLNLCTEKFKLSAIDIIVDIDPEKKIFCNDTQISQVLLNLLSNAHDAIKEIKEKWVKMYSRVVGDELSIYIVDSGKILDKRIKQNIFQPFFTTKPKGVGTGLGTSISKGIIEEHGGKLEYLEDEKNTTFRITLPISDKIKGEKLVYH